MIGATLRLMRKYPSRMTARCPLCGDQLVVHVRFPLPENWGIKQPEVIDWRCQPGCSINEAQVREALRLNGVATEVTG
jgi:hypothetical protein